MIDELFTTTWFLQWKRAAKTLATVPRQKMGENFEAKPGQAPCLLGFILGS